MGKGFLIDASKMGRPAPISSHGKSKGQEMVHVGVEMRLSITYRYDLRTSLQPRVFNKHLNETNREVMMYWHRELRPKHFTLAGQAEYKYQRRTRATEYRKKKLFGHNDPIKMTGNALAMSSNIKSLRATPSSAAITVAGPWYMAVRVQRKDGKLSPDLKAELSRFSKRDAMLLARFGAKRLRERILQDRKNKLGAKAAKP